MRKPTQGWLEERSAKVGRAQKVGFVWAEEKDLWAGKTAQAQAWREKKQDARGQTRRQVCRRLCSPTEARASPCPAYYSWPEGPGAAWSDQQTIRPWFQPSALLGKMQSLEEASRAAGCLQQEWPSDPGRQEVKCQPASPWVAQGPTEPEGCQAKTQPGLLGAWPPFEESS